MDYLSCHMWYQLGPVLAYSDHRLPCRPKRHLANILEWHWLKNRKKGDEVDQSCFINPVKWIKGPGLSKYALRREFMAEIHI